MKKLKQIKKAIRNTPPDRLAKIEYQSHFLQMIGVSAVCGILIWKGFWYIIFAFIFSLGISYSQGVSAYQKYSAIKDITGETYNYKKDRSPSRRRDYIVKKIFGRWFWIVVVCLSIFLALLFIPYGIWYTKILFAFSILFFYVIFYFFIFYWFAKKVFDKGGRK